MPKDLTTSKTAYWASWALSVGVAALFILSATLKLTASPRTVEMFGHLGWQPGALANLAVLECVYVLLYLVPKTSVLGAIVLTAYLGGAIATHVRLEQPYFGPVILGVSRPTQPRCRRIRSIPVRRCRVSRQMRSPASIHSIGCPFGLVFPRDAMCAVV